MPGPHRSRSGRHWLGLSISYLKLPRGKSFLMPEDSLPPSHRSALFSLFLIAALIVYASYAILLLWREPHLLALCLLPAPLALMARLGPSGPATAAAGAVIGPLTEAACVAGGLWSYAETGGCHSFGPGYRSSGPAFPPLYG